MNSKIFEQIVFLLLFCIINLDYVEYSLNYSLAVNLWSLLFQEERLWIDQETTFSRAHLS